MNLDAEKLCLDQSVTLKTNIHLYVTNKRRRSDEVVLLEIEPTLVLDARIHASLIFRFLYTFQQTSTIYLSS